MKKLVFFISMIFLVFAIGCNKEEEAMQPAGNSSLQEMKVLNLMRCDVSGTESEILQIKLPFGNSTENFELRTSSNHSANGHFSPIVGYPGTFSAVQNNGGTHGNAIINLPWAGIHLNIECLIVEENVAVVEGLITQIFYDYCDGCMVPGQYFSFEVIDNGEGHNAPADQIGSFIYWSDEPLCGVLPPNSPDWGPLLDVTGQGDQIQVK